MKGLDENMTNIYTYNVNLMTGYTLWDKKRSTDRREQLGIFNINDKLTQYKINWRNIYKNG